MRRLLRSRVSAQTPTTGKKIGAGAGKPAPASTIMARLTKAYTDYIKSQQWEMKKNAYWATVPGGRKCQACGSNKLVHVHHKTYIRFGREDLKDLVGLCSACHRIVHRLHRTKGGSLAFWTDRHVYLERKKRGLA